MHKNIYPSVYLRPIWIALASPQSPQYKRIKAAAKHQAEVGFSLLEMLLVVALIGILAAYAIPTYQGYLEQTRFMEVVQQSQAVRVSQSSCLMQSGQDINSCDSYGELALQAPAPTDNTDSVAVTESTGVITGTGTSASGAFTYILTPEYNSEGVLGYSTSGTCVDAGVC